MVRCVLTCLTSISLANVPKYVRPVMMQSTDLNELGDDVSATPWGRTIHERCSRHGQGDRYVNGFCPTYKLPDRLHLHRSECPRLRQHLCAVKTLSRCSSTAL
eukprot:m.118770 g.118770  ORF g.118770 m.118770 type:complete len:103 (-) comp13259_c0_seq2:1379-1687(-)